MKVGEGFYLLTLVTVLLLLSMTVVSFYITSVYDPLIYKPENLDNMSPDNTLDLLRKKVTELGDIIISILSGPEHPKGTEGTRTNIPRRREGEWAKTVINIVDELPKKSLREIVGGMLYIVENISVGEISPTTISNLKLLLAAVGKAADRELCRGPDDFDMKAIRSLCLQISSAITKLERRPR